MGIPKKKVTVTVGTEVNKEGTAEEKKTPVKKAPAKTVKKTEKEENIAEKVKKVVAKDSCKAKTVKRAIKKDLPEEPIKKDVTERICYEAEKEAEIETCMNNLIKQTGEAFVSLKRTMNEFTDEEIMSCTVSTAENDCLTKIVTSLIETRFVVEGISSVLGFLDSWLENGDCPRFKVPGFNCKK